MIPIILSFLFINILISKCYNLGNAITVVSIYIFYFLTSEISNSKFQGGITNAKLVKCN